MQGTMGGHGLENETTPTPFCCMHHQCYVLVKGVRLGMVWGWEKEDTGILVLSLFSHGRTSVLKSGRTELPYF